MKGSRFAVVIGGHGSLGSAFVRALKEKSPVFSVVRKRARHDDADMVIEDPSLDCRHAAQHINQISQQMHMGSMVMLINTRGILHGPKDMPEKSLAEISQHWALESFQVNALSHILAIESFRDLILASRSTKRHTDIDLEVHRVVVSSISARVGSIEDNGLGGWHSYRASKAALNQFLRGASIELQRRHKNAVVAAIHPGLVESALSEPFSRKTKYHKQAPDEAAGKILSVLDSLGPTDSGGFYDYSGAKVPF